MGRIYNHIMALNSQSRRMLDLINPMGENNSIDNKKSILDGIILQERVDMKVLGALVSSTLLKTDKTNYLHQQENERKQIEKYYQGFNKEGIRKVKYVTGKNLNFGRVNPEGGLGAHCIRKQIRHAILYNLYVDIDIVNAHPEILLQVCQVLQIECYYLAEYVKNRLIWLQEIQHHHQLRDIKDAKELVIQILYLASYSKWANQQEVSTLNKKVSKLRNEIIGIVDQLSEKYDKFYQIISKMKKKNKKSSFISYFLQNIENIILTKMFNYLQDNDIIDDDVILSNDGIMIPSEVFYEELIDQLELEIKDTTDFQLKLKVKSMNQGYRLSEIEELQRPNCKIDFFEELDINNQQFHANLYYQLNPNKYVYHENIGWFEYDEYNKLINCVVHD